MTDQHVLLQRSRQFDEEALAEIYDSYSPEIYKYALRLSGNTDTADECVAETFSRFLFALRAGHGPNDHLKAYLYRVAHNWLTDRYRRARPEYELDPELRAAPGAEPDMIVVARMERQEIQAALGLLTADQRQVIALKYLQEMENAEISVIIQKPVGAVKALQHRGLAALKRILIAKHSGTDQNPDEFSLQSTHPVD